MTRRLDMINETSLVRGIVAINEDPERRGRIKVRIPSYHGIPKESRTWIEDAALPWATPGILVSAGNDVGQRIIPTVGTRIFVMFEDGDLDKPVYLGGIPLLIGDTKYYNTIDSTVLGKSALQVNTNDEMLDFNKSETQASQGILFKSLKGFTIYYDDTDGNEQIKIIDQSGQMIKMMSHSPITSRRGTSEVPNGKSEISLISKNTKMQIGNIVSTDNNGNQIQDEGLVITLPSFILGD